MRKFLLPALLLLGAAGCAREPGFRPDEVLDWSIQEYTIHYDGCTDSPNWRSSFVSTIGRNEPRRAVRLSEDAQTAQMLFCGASPTSACVPIEPAVVFTVDGHSLRYTKTILQEIDASACRISFAQSIVIEDRGEEMTETYTYDYALVGEAEPCAEFNGRIAAQGTNGIGIDGCTVTIVSQGVL